MHRKIKFSLEFKKECLDLLFDNKGSLNSISKEKGVSKELLRRWFLLYEKKGMLGLIPMPTKHYPASFKLHVLEAISTRGISLPQACIDYDIGSHSTIINWKRRYESKGFIGLQDNPNGRPSKVTSKPTKSKTNKVLSKEEELLQENKSLKAELDYLKKLQALIQAKVSKKKRY